MQHPDRRDIVRGQYEVIAEETGVGANSDVETYAALRFEIDSWRWAGVPFFVRTGKRLPVTATEVMATFRRPPQRLFDESLPPRANYLRFRLGPDRVAIALGARIKSPGEAMTGHEVELYACNSHGGRDDAVRAAARRRDARRRDAVRAPGLGRGGVGDRRSHCSQADRRPNRTTPAAGARPRPSAWSSASAAGTTRRPTRSDPNWRRVLHLSGATCDEARAAGDEAQNERPRHASK